MNPWLGKLAVVECASGRFRITGQLDLATAPRVNELQDTHGPLLLDLHGVTFMDSSGVAALVRLHKRCPDQGCTLRIEACSLPVERVLRIAGLYDLFTQDAEPTTDRAAHDSMEMAPRDHDRTPAAAP